MENIPTISESEYQVMKIVNKASPKGGLKSAIALVLVIAISLSLVSCENQEKVKDDKNFTVIEENSVDSVEEEKSYVPQIIGDYKYPEKPADELRKALLNDVARRGLPMKIGNVEKVEFDEKECTLIKIDLPDSKDNMCIITFINKYLNYSYSDSLDENDNPSFTMAFKDPDNSQDMVMVLTSVILCLSPELSAEEAQRLAERQDTTISTDGYSQPSDIGGYQVQAQYTNPHVFAQTPDFDAKLGVKVRALKQIWRRAIDVGKCVKMETPADYDYLTAQYYSWDEGKYPEMVYADFIVKNTWRDQSYIHGETWVVVEVESMTGEKFSISLDTWAFPNTYEFGVGQQYTLFIGLKYTSGVSGGIMYAVQKSESEQFNLRGEQHPLDYPTEAWYDHNRLRRVEPKGDGTIYNVYFVLQSQTWGESFAALEGHGIGDAQWPGSDPEWDDYTFVGWYDNTEFNGKPYTKDKPIYKDTYLYAKWKYTGPGGIWPRVHRGIIGGIENSSSLTVGQELNITVSGYNMDLQAPKEQRFRWKPISWRLSDKASGNFSDAAPFQAKLSLNNAGEKRLFITYSEEIYDGYGWQKTGQQREVEEVTLNVK